MLYFRNPPDVSTRFPKQQIDQWLSMHVNDKENYAYWPLGVLSAHIKAKQGIVTGEMLPKITLQFGRVEELYRKIHPEIGGVAQLFRETAEQIAAAYAHDAVHIYPYVHELVRCHGSAAGIAIPVFSSLSRIKSDQECAHREMMAALDCVIDMTFTFNRFSQVDAAHNSLMHELNTAHDCIQSIAHLKLRILFERAIGLENTVAREPNILISKMRQDG